MEKETEMLFGYPVRDVVDMREGLTFATIDASRAVDFVTHLKTREGYEHLVMISCVDYIEDNRFQLTYILHHPEKKTDIGVRTLIDRDEAVMAGMHDLWPAASVYQREIHEMFGVTFPGSPRQDEPLILEGWQDIPPMRKDFDTLKYSTETYFPREGRTTHDPKEYMEEKLYPHEAKVKYGVKRQFRNTRGE